MEVKDVAGQGAKAKFDVSSFLDSSSNNNDTSIPSWQLKDDEKKHHSTEEEKQDDITPKTQEQLESDQVINAQTKEKKLSKIITALIVCKNQKRDEPIQESSDPKILKTEGKKLSFVEVTQMISEGKQPDDIRTINDKPPDPNCHIPKSGTKAPLKPWELKKSSSSTNNSSPQQYKIYTVSAFSKNPASGNFAGVCPLPAHVKLSTSQMLSLAKTMNFSETAFIQSLNNNSSSNNNNQNNVNVNDGDQDEEISKEFKESGGNFSLRWFTPTVEVPLCGHATLASAHALFNNMSLPFTTLNFSTLSGILSVSKSPSSASSLIMQFPSGNPVPVHNLSFAPFLLLLSALNSLLPSDVLEIQHCSKTRKLVVVLSADTNTLKSLKPNPTQLVAIDFILGNEENANESQKLEVKGIIVTTNNKTEEFKDYDYVSRYFAPWAGIDEDPVTGSAHTVLGVYWGKKLGKTETKAHQASERGGEMKCNWDEGKSIMVLQGDAVTHSEQVVPI